MTTRSARLLLAAAIVALVAATTSLAPAASAKGNPHQNPTTTTTTAPRTATVLTMGPAAMYVVPACAPPFACPIFRFYSELVGLLTTTDGLPIAGRTVRMHAGDTGWGWCYGFTDSTGTARCSADQFDVVHGSNIEAKGWFDGDADYAPSSSSFGV